MTEFDFDHLGDVWRQQPDPAELEALKRAAEACAAAPAGVSLIDISSALIVSGVVLSFVLLNPKRDTVDRRWRCHLHSALQHVSSAPASPGGIAQPDRHG